MKWIATVLLLFLVSSLCLAAEKKEEKLKPAQSIPELQQQLEKILKDTHTPGVSVAIVHKDGPEWVTGLGIADVAGKYYVPAIGAFLIYLVMLALLMWRPTGIFGRR